MTTSICMTEIDRCIRGSVATFFVFLSGQKHPFNKASSSGFVSRIMCAYAFSLTLYMYGWRPLPPQVEAVEFNTICSKITSDEDREFINNWCILFWIYFLPRYVDHIMIYAITTFRNLRFSFNQYPFNKRLAGAKEWLSKVVDVTHISSKIKGFMVENHKEASGIWWKTEERLQTLSIYHAL